MGKYEKFGELDIWDHTAAIVAKIEKVFWIYKYTSTEKLSQNILYNPGSLRSYGI